MRIIKDGVFVNTMENYSEIKDKLVWEILQSPGESLDDITKTDWDGHSYHHQTGYWQTVLPFVLDSYQQIRTHLYQDLTEYVGLDIGYSWYQVYGYESQHTYHNHPGCQFSNVFFVDLPNGDFKTKFFGLDDIDVKEGDLITFPAWYLHRSPPNLGQKNKIVVSFNTSFNCQTKFDTDK